MRETLRHCPAATSIHVWESAVPAAPVPLTRSRSIISQGAADYPGRCDSHCDTKERRKEQAVVDESRDGTHASESGQTD
jgi:hypothetical protein